MNILSKFWAYIVSAGAFLITVLLYKNEKSKRKTAETERDTAKSNVKLLVKREKIVTDIDILREKDSKKSAEMLNDQRSQLERLKHEDDDRIVTAGLMGLLGKNDNKD